MFFKRLSFTAYANEIPLLPPSQKLAIMWQEWEKIISLYRLSSIIQVDTETWGDQQNLQDQDRQALQDLSPTY
jgi:hypothetical protein